MKFYFTAQGGSYGKANTIWFWPALSLAQDEEGFDFGQGKQHWCLTVCFLFWATGVTW